MATVNGGTNARRTSNTELTASHCDVLWSNCVSCAPNDIYPTVYSLSQLSYCGPSAEEHCCVAQLRVMLTHEHVDFFLNDRQNNCQTNNPTYSYLLSMYCICCRHFLVDSSLCVVILRTEHIKILKRHSHSHCAGLVDFYITLNYSLTIG